MQDEMWKTSIPAFETLTRKDDNIKISTIFKI